MHTCLQKKSLMAKPNTHDINRVRHEASKTPFVCGDFERDGKEGEFFFFFFSVFSQRRKWGRKLVEPRIFLLGPPKCKLPKIGRKLERKCKGEKVLPFWTTLSPCATGFFFFWLCRFFRFCLLLELLLNSSHSFLFFYIFFHLFWFFFFIYFSPSFVLCYCTL